MSDLLRSLMINGQYTQKNLTKIVFFGTFLVRKKKVFHSFLFLMSDVSKLLRSLTKSERCEQIAQVAQ